MCLYIEEFPISLIGNTKDISIVKNQMLKILLQTFKKFLNSKSSIPKIFTESYHTLKGSCLSVTKHIFEIK